MLNSIIDQSNDSINESVYYAGQLRATELQEISLLEIFDAIRTGKNGLREKIQQIRALPTQDERNALKPEILPLFCWSTYKDNRRKNKLLERSHFILLDFDHLNPETRLAELRAAVRDDRRVYAAFVSPSGDGLKVMYKLDKDVTDPTRYTELYIHYADIFSVEYGCPWDKSTKDSARGCFLSYDPDIYVNKNATPLPVDVVVSVIPQSKKEAIAKALQGTNRGNRTYSATQIAGFCVIMAFPKILRYR